VPDPPAAAGPPDPARLRAAAARLAAELDEARLYQAAAYASMAADSIGRSCGGGAREPSVRTGAECAFELDERGRVWMIGDGDCRIVGRVEAVRAGMRRFLAAALPGRGR
jgi:hypothetical protein